MVKIKDLPKIERPREKLEKYGPERLSNSELLAILLRTGSKGVNVVELSNKILKKFGSDGLSKATVKELKNTFGLGSAKTCEIMACFELGRRLLQNKQAFLILSPKDVWEDLKDIRDNKKEHFVVLFLDARNQEMKREIISIGSLTANFVHPREVFEPAVRYLAAQIIIAHNHPSGIAEPSQADLAITRRLRDALGLVDIRLLDHFIVGDGAVVSLAERGLV